MIQTSPLWLNYKQLNLDICNIVSRVETRSESMSAFFGKITKSGYPDPKTDVAFLRCDKTKRVDPTFCFWIFHLLPDFIPNLTMIFIALFSLGWTKGARKTHCWWGKWQTKHWSRVGCSYRFGWWSRWNYTDNITCWSLAPWSFISKTRHKIWGVFHWGRTWILLFCRR